MHHHEKMVLEGKAKKSDRQKTTRIKILVVAERFGDKRGFQNARIC